jgi:hypothetical protein
MWFFFGVFTLIAGTIWGLKVRLESKWRGTPENLGAHFFEIQQNYYKKRLLRVRLGIRTPGGLHFRVRAERMGDRFFKWLGVSTEIQTRNAAFDRTIYVESDSRATAVVLKRNAQLRAALFDLFIFAKAQRLRRMKLRCVHGRLWVEFVPKVDKDLFAAKTHLVPLLYAIKAGLACMDLPLEYRRDRFIRRAALMLAFSTSSLVLGFTGLVRALTGRTDIIDPWLLFAACLLPALLITVAGVTLALAWLIGTSRAHVVALEFAIVGGIGLMLSTFVLAREANMTFDFQPARRVELAATSTEERIHHGRRRDYSTYYLHCLDWRKGHEGESLRLQIPYATYYALQPQRPAVLYVRPGLFHFDWIERIEPASW